MVRQMVWLETLDNLQVVMCVRPLLAVERCAGCPGLLVCLSRRAVTGVLCCSACSQSSRCSWGDAMGRVEHRRGPALPVPRSLGACEHWPRYRSARRALHERGGLAWLSFECSRDISQRLFSKNTSLGPSDDIVFQILMKMGGATV